MNSTVAPPKVKERSVYFPGKSSDDSIRAILEGRKTQDRRIVKPKCGCPDFFCIKPDDRNPYYFRRADAVWDSFKSIEDLAAKYCPHGSVGDRLWVRETWRPKSWGADFDWMFVEFKDGSTKQIDPIEAWGDSILGAERVWENLSNECVQSGSQLEDGYFKDVVLKWKPSIHMPRAASRITLEITGVKVERLQDISEEDAIAEGIQSFEPGEGSKFWRNYQGDEKDLIDGWFFREEAILSFRSLWDSINGEKPGCDWASNPFTWTIEFRRIEQEAA
jgi:hypothetical protein